MEAKEYVQRLKDISSKKLVFFDEILLFARSQNEVIKGQRYEETDRLLKERQKRMDAVDKLDEQFMVYSSRLKDILGTAELKEIVGDIQQKLSKIQELDEESAALVKAEMQDTREKISNTSAHKRATGAYYPSDSTTSYYFDKKK